MGLRPRTFLLGLLLLLGGGKSAFCSEGNRWVSPAGVPCCFGTELGRGIFMSTKCTGENKQAAALSLSAHSCGGQAVLRTVEKCGRATAPWWGSKP